jgi:hypothetical protein
MTKLTYEVLEQLIDDAYKIVAPGSKWRHYKGGEYTIKAIAVLEEDQNLAVVYTSIEHPTVSFVRPLSVWNEQVEWRGKTVNRFSKF